MPDRDKATLDESSTASTTPEKKESAGNLPCERISAEAARAKLAYLLNPSASQLGSQFQTSQEVDQARECGLDATQSSSNADLAMESTEQDEASEGDIDEIAALRRENARLRMQLQNQQEQRDVAMVLGVRSTQCAGCRSGRGVENRVFAPVEPGKINGKLYCDKCWSSWERSGWWHPAMRVMNVPPAIGASGLPDFLPEDAFSIPAFICAHDDFSLLARLQAELPEGKSFSDWHGARHLGLQLEGSDVSSLRMDSAPPALRETVKRLEEAFGIRASAARMNVYRSSADYKPFHADRGKDEEGVPQVTVGLSLGATRELSFAHWQTGLTLSFPQRNGDVFAFTPELNQVFVHGVPKVTGGGDDGERLSLILWGSRIVVQQAHDAAKAKRKLNEEGCPGDVRATPQDDNL
eukprot:TRINITY_DN27483_c0_g1_i1.p1 TRINITY_DN27483_c0_g1~~TRINITY_DN27483_c0_g1_i1.p1  ORF type:complete len:443 (+),score=73.06 TRINITY_DN27483_c0_g1_i1:103-1329(+)